MDDKREVEAYFNGKGFTRWAKIYSDTPDVNKVQLQIRRGHSETVDTVLRWLGDEPAGTSMLDAGCGVGSLTLPLAQRGMRVHGVDISAAMVAEAQRRAAELGAGVGAGVGEATFAVGDADTAAANNPAPVVICLDVMIHYALPDALGMLRRLADGAGRRLIVSFAPSTPYLDALKAIGSVFPGPSKATRAYLHKEQEVRRVLQEAGFMVCRSRLCSTPFYFSSILDCRRI